MGEEMECARRCGIPTARRLTQTPYKSFHVPAWRPLVSSGTLPRLGELGGMESLQGLILLD
jgi:hypothetical protein